MTHQLPCIKRNIVTLILRQCERIAKWLLGWLFWVQRPFETVFVYIGPSPKEKKKRQEMLQCVTNAPESPLY